MRGERKLTSVLQVNYYLLVVLLFCSCRFFAGKPADHSALVKPVLARAGDLPVKDPQRVKGYLDSAFRHIPNPGPGDLYSKYDFLRKYYFEKVPDYPKALLYADSMITILQPFADNQLYNLLYAESKLYKGDILFRVKRFDEAYYEFYQGEVSIGSATNSDDHRVFLFNFYTRLADISYGQGRFTDAVLWHKKAIAELQRSKMDKNKVYLIQGALDNIALSYSNAAMADSANKYYAQALRLINSQYSAATDPAQKRDLDIARGVVFGNEGTVCLQQGDVAKAEEKFTASIAINSRPGYANEDALITRIKLAELYIYSRRLSKAGELIRQIHASPDTLTIAQDKLRLKMLDASLADGTGKTAEANLMLRDYIRQMIALKAANRNLMSTDFQREFKSYNRQNSLRQLEKQAQLKNVYLAGALLICLLAVMILYLVLKSNKNARAAAQQSEQHNRQLEMTLAALEISAQENTELLKVVAHDFKNPVSAIYGISELMAGEQGRTTDDLEMLDLIKVTSKNLDTLIHDLLASKINRRSAASEKMPAGLDELIRESVSLLQYRAGDKKQRIVMEAAPAVVVCINRDRVWRVINNLIVNAIKFSPENTVIRVSLQIAEQEVVIRVMDQGIGIPDQIKEQIFQLSAEAKRQGTSGEDTYGMGLYISKQIVEEQGGRIWFENNADHGTSFYFSLPLSQ